jgi:hypothetical protein
MPVRLYKFRQGIWSPQLMKKIFRGGPRRGAKAVLHLPDL